ncbi:MAG: hypothetical protein KAU44_07450, partial [Candidatus Marinimicrobia bacterium]|nr:hypothetical protein [Candidatus Neomarinimicrobiota bacterium]
MKKWILVLTLLFVSLGLAKAPEGYLGKLKSSTLELGYRTLSNISNWACWVYYTGGSAHSPSGSSGGIYPRGTTGAIYQDGLLWGGKYDTNKDGIGDEIRVGGANYNIGTVPGRVITGGDYGEAVVADLSDPAVRLYRIRPDHYYLTHEDLIQDAAELNMIGPSSVTEAMTQEIMDQYALDWEEWPAEWGAPYYDEDDDGIFTLGVDEPGIAQADQVVWYVVNDYSATATTSLYGSQPIGIELQTTIWAYDQERVRLGQIIFKSYKLINKSNSLVTDMYLAQWSDPDIGYYGDDFCGCDTVLNLGYAYNGDNSDSKFDSFNIGIPAAGYDLLQGPMVESPGDTAIFDLKPREDHKNLDMTSFSVFTHSTWDPDPFDYYMTLYFYTLMRGYRSLDRYDNP